MSDRAAVIEITAAEWIERADAILAEHPVRRVRLTTMPEWDAEDDPNGIPGLLAWHWPGIEFELPQPAPVPPVSMTEALMTGNTAGFQAYVAQQLTAVAQSLAVPPHILNGTNAGGGE